MVLYKAHSYNILLWPFLKYGFIEVFIETLNGNIVCVCSCVNMYVHVEARGQSVNLRQFSTSDADLIF